MAELATIARPYAEALFKAGAGSSDLAAALQQVRALAAVAADTQLRLYVGDPKVEAAQAYALMAGVVNMPLSPQVQNFLRAVLDNGRLEALPEIAAQFQALVNAQSGISDATVFSAFPIENAQLADVTTTLEKRFARKLNASVVVQPELIGGIRVVVGDEVLDTSVKARLEQMKVALAA